MRDQHREIFLVVGQTDDYDHRYCWNVRAFENVEDARALAEKLNAWCVENGVNDERAGESLRKLANAQQVKFYTEWWAKNGDGSSLHTGYNITNQGSYDAACVEMHAAFYNTQAMNNPNFPIAKPVDDPNCRLWDYGTSYRVDAVAQGYHE